MQLDVIYILNPAGFDPRDILPRRFHGYGDHARYVIDRTLMRFDPEDDFGLGGTGCRLNMQVLSRIAGRSDAATGIMAALRDNGLLATDGRYVVGVRSRSYIPGPAVVGKPIVRVPITHPGLLRKLRQARERQLLELPHDIYRALIRKLDGLDFDLDRAVAALERYAGEESWERELAWRRTLERFRDPSPSARFYSVCPYGRLHTALTSAPRGFRGLLSHRGEPMVNVDVRNSQPACLAALLAEVFPPGNRPPDVDGYIAACSAGRLYEEWMAAAGYDADRRDDFKRKAFTVFYGENRMMRGPVAEAFQNRWPTVSEHTRTMKLENHGALACAMQQAESSIVIAGAATRFLMECQDGTLASIHDSLVTPEGYAVPATAALQEAFEDRGVKVAVRTEPCESHYFGRPI